MNEAVVCFIGICTHVTSVPMTPPPDAVGHDPLPSGRYHRTVLVDGRLGLRVSGKGLAPHDAILAIPSQFVAGDPGEIKGLTPIPNPDGYVWRMEGVSMYIRGAETTLAYDPSFDNIPSLTDKADVLSLQLDPRVVLDGRSAARFDIFGGTLEAFQEKEAVIAALTVKTVQPEPELVVTRMWDEHPSVIKLKAGSFGTEPAPPHVFVLNTGQREEDDPIDFLMHYDVTTFTPDAPTILGRLKSLDAPPLTKRSIVHWIPQGLTVGCSNSVYP
jgi:hypothetical protein